MVTIKKSTIEGGHVYEIRDFADYARLLDERGIEPPLARVRVFISHENEALISQSFEDWSSQIAMLFKLSPVVGIPYQIVADDDVRN